MIFQILELDLLGFACEPNEYDDYYCIGAPTVPGQFRTPTSEPPMTSLDVVAFPSSVMSSTATSSAASGTKPVLSAAPSSKTPVQTESGRESTTSQGAEHVASHKHPHYNHQHLHHHHHRH
ncbi:hypothetical protein BOTNAR_2213g00020 [Botryotinia narcissicola]|uniref:Uncharacterized protein n=1 Tax=Botryotinia narcissicola TaxID=278944 RepID=A0A4Z1H9Y6_9HELO|nr:hypothetical protein BOTNAR_2213g00020 [Botryotinia narcissicola]